MEPILVVCLCVIIGLVCVGVVGYVLFRPVAVKESLDNMAAATDVPEDSEDRGEDGDASEDGEEPVEDSDTVSEEEPTEDQQA